jgi:hypothetical protein
VAPLPLLAMIAVAADQDNPFDEVMSCTVRYVVQYSMILR